MDRMSGGRFNPAAPLGLEPPTIPEEPYPFGSGTLVFSSCLALESWPSVVWDVNGYYHELGVGFRASRYQLRLAYQARKGDMDGRLTYVFSQLLNSQTRRDYDATPLGHVFLDFYVEQRIKNKAKQTAQSYRAMGLDISEEEVLAEMGFKATPKDPNGFDIPQKAGDDGSTQRSRKQVKPGPGPTFYLKKMLVNQLPPGAVLFMSEWRTAIFEALYSEKITMSFAIGMMAGRPGVEVLSVAGVKVAFVSVEEFSTAGIKNIESLAALTAQQLTPTTDVVTDRAPIQGA